MFKKKDYNINSKPMTIPCFFFLFYSCPLHFITLKTPSGITFLCSCVLDSISILR